MACQRREPWIEPRSAITPVEDRRILVVDQHTHRYAAEGLEWPDQSPVGVLGVAARHRHHVDGARVVQHVRRQIDRPAHAADLQSALAPVVLQLRARRRLVAHGPARRTQRPPEVSAQAQNRAPAVVVVGLDPAEDHLCIPGAPGQHGIHMGAIRVELAAAALRVSILLS